MDQKMLFKQMIDFQKATFDNSFKAMTTLQQQGEKMVDMFLFQAPRLREQRNKAVRDSTPAHKNGRDDFRNTVEVNFTKMQDYLSV